MFGVCVSVPGHYGTVHREMENIGHGDHMAIKVPLAMLLSYKIGFPNSTVLGICISLSQAVMALCIERVEIWSR